ncbi:serine hydrolase [Kutzneria sp. 744]|uniref:serine hydrolase domain-containing protein n=1 Tax=Kutzneria sp. (strain 744) TaxID=345341 RepID=UPI0003EEC5F4|nr:serine hydrolase domain-containing protein [Kutzneria sp. 744]EWM13248.1 beta-lactamase [Kutzneria sp. 744]
MDSAGSIGRRRLLGLTAAGVVAAAAPVAHADPVDCDIPPATRPGGAYDRYVAQLAAEGRFSGVVTLSHRGRTVLSRSYGLADREKGIRNHEGIAFSLSSAGKPFGAVAVLQLVQQGKLKLSDTVGTYLTGYAKGIADKVTIHHLLSGTSGTASPDEDVRRVFQSRDEVHAYYEQWARQSTPVDPPGTPADHVAAEVQIPAQIVEAVSGRSYWDYVQDNIFRRCGMTGTGFFTRPQWLTDPHIAHPYMTLADGSQVDAVRHLDQGSPAPDVLGKNPGRAFVDAPGDGGFATAPDLVRFGQALFDGTLLDRPWADVLTGAKIPHGPTSFGAYSLPVHILNRQWVFGRAGANPGVAASWNIYPDTGWIGVTLGNSDGLPLQEMSVRESQAVTEASC